MRLFPFQFDFGEDDDAFILAILKKDAQAKSGSMNTVGFVRSIEVNITSIGNAGAGLDPLHSFTLPAGSLAKNGDYLKVRYSGVFNGAAGNRRIRTSFGGVVVQDTTISMNGGLWWDYDTTYVRTSSTSVLASTVGCWGDIVRDSAGVLSGNGFPFAFNIPVPGLANLNTTDQVLLVEGESAGAVNDDIVQNLSIIELVQN